MSAKDEHDTNRRRRMRLPNYDYSSPGAYFVTICTHRRMCQLGHVANGAMHLNSFGRIAETCWNELPTHYPNAALDAFVVMPNHIHGVVVLEETAFSKHGLTEIIRGFKTFSARRINEVRTSQGVPLWQRGFYERIIRTEIALNEIRHYVETNPAFWALDGNNPAKLPA